MLKKQAQINLMHCLDGVYHRRKEDIPAGIIRLRHRDEVVHAKNADDAVYREHSGRDGVSNVGVRSIERE